MGCKLTFVFFLICTAATGFIYWYVTDWWVYADHFMQGPIPKFRLTIWEQVAISLFFGVALSTVLTLTLWISVRMLRQKRPVD
jgi:hypothetical protein